MSPNFGGPIVWAIGRMVLPGGSFADVGLTPRIPQGAADLCRFVAGTPIGYETPKHRDSTRDQWGVGAALANELGRDVGS